MNVTIYFHISIALFIINISTNDFSSLHAPKKHVPTLIFVVGRWFLGSLVITLPFRIFSILHWIHFSIRRNYHQLLNDSLVINNHRLRSGCLKFNEEQYRFQLLLITLTSHPLSSKQTRLLNIQRTKLDTRQKFYIPI